MKYSLYVIGLMASLLAGCTTDYKTGEDLGVSYTKRTQNTYIVRFHGTAHTYQSSAEEMALLKAAELSLEKGYAYFILLKESSIQAAYSSGTNAIFSRSTHRPRVILLIKMFHEEPVNPELTEEWINAQDIVDELGKKYIKPAEEA